MKISFIVTLVFSLITTFCIAQLGKHGNISITSQKVVNEYTSLTADANATSTSLTVSNSSLNTNGRFVNTLEAGDLILIIQHQGASLNPTTTPQDWGAITNYNNAGNYEYCEVSNIPNANTIELRCGLTKNYTAAGKVQIVRIPRYENLTVNSILTADAWNGQFGGIIALECNNDLIINTSGSITANGLGFRGGIEDYASTGSGSWWVANTNPDGGGAKGESIFGYDTDYSSLGGKYGYAAPANAGGGGNCHNGGGGGGANAGTVSNWQLGVGIPNPTYNTAWALESPAINGVTASGGGKGGYTFSSNNSNPNNTGPNDYGVWAGDGRRPLGGLGGRPLDYSSGKIFFGGGGGSGDVNDSQTLGGHGGNSGGIILIECKGTISGNGEIIANGANGIDAYTTSPPATGFAGNDGAGGGGAGGTVLINSLNILTNLNVSASGGDGGNQVLDGGVFYFGSFNEAEGPGGGGGGGYIAHSNGTVISNINGGINGVTNSNSMTNFPPNGATSGGIGSISSNTLSTFSLTGINDTICAGNAATVSVTVNGTLPLGGLLIWYDAASNGNFIGAGTSFSTTNISNDTTFYVGVCPGTFTVPVSVIIGTSFSYSDANVIVEDENCSLSDGSISGITISGGALPLQYEWNGNISASQDLSNLGAGSYTLVVTDANGCAATIGTYNINNNTGPTVDDSGLTLVEDHCSQGIGSISGLIIAGNSPYSYTWNGTSSSSTDLANLSSGSYDLTIEDVNGCTTDYNGVVITDINGPTINSSNLITTNATCGIDNGSISGIVVTNPSNGALTTNWDNSSETTLDLQNLMADDYNLTVSDAFGCSDSFGPITITSVGTPVAGFNVTPNPVIIGDTVYYVNNSSNDVTNYYFTLSNDSTMYDTIGQETFSSPGEYEVCLNVSNNAGCVDSTCQTIQVEENLVVIVPNIFTPNNDFVNETFIIQGLRNASLTIFNRWGKEVFSQSPYSNGWNGYSNAGKKLAGGTYYYILQPLDNSSTNEEMTGYLLLVR